MRIVLWVGAGGFVGSICRYLLSGMVQEWTGRQAFPAGTLAVNVLGCLAIGMLSALAETRGAFSTEVRALLVVGFLGGFTTFSSFGIETVNLWRDGGWLAFGNVAAQLVLGLGAVWLGRALGQGWWG